MYRYQFTPVALRQLKKFPKDIQKRIIKKLEFYLNQSHPLQYADFLIDSRLGEFRFRIGDYRVVFDVKDDTIVILVIGHRREIYRRK